MNLDPAELARQAAAVLAVYWGATGGKAVEGAFSAAGKSIFEWLKGKFTRPAASGALEEAEENPSSPVHLEALVLQIRKALEEDEQFRQGLLERMPEEVRNRLRVEQSAAATGKGNVIVQVAGSGAQIRIGSGNE